MPPHPPVAPGPGDSTPATVVRTELFDATDTAALGILDQPADRVVLLPFDLGLACEPSIRRQPAQDPTPGPPVVVVTLDPNAKSMREHGFGSFRTGLLRPDWSREGYTRAVSEALALIAAGDCYQVNLSHRLSTDFAGCARALHAILRRASPPPDARTKILGTPALLHPVPAASVSSRTRPTRPLPTRSAPTITL